jgi:hypothetical protein
LRAIGPVCAPATLMKRSMAHLSFQPTAQST